jgi:hypothetical protein
MPRSNDPKKKREESKDNDKDEVETNVHSTLDDNTLGYTLESKIVMLDLTFERFHMTYMFVIHKKTDYF